VSREIDHRWGVEEVNTALLRQANIGLAWNTSLIQEKCDAPVDAHAAAVAHR
jgi:hypothetical protein